MKKLKVLQFSLIIIAIFFIIFLFLPKNYTKKYKLNEVLIEETYNKKSKYYYFTFNYNNITLDYLVDTNYKITRGLIDIVDIIKDENNKDNFCLIPTSKIDMIPLCYEDNEAIYFKNVNSNLQEQLNKNYFKTAKLIETYEDIEIYNKEFTYLIWNYNGFYYIKDNESKKINIFDKELYTINLIGYTEDYLVVPDYDDNYTYDRIYTIAFKNGNLKKHDFDTNIYFDSYFLGYIKNNLYIVDKKESKMYEFDAKKGKITKADNKIYQNGSWIDVNIKTLINQKQEFTYNTNYHYTLEDDTLYLTYIDKSNKIKIADNITYLVKVKDNDIFYLKTDSLYHFNNATGEELLLTYFEWNFNFENMIYIN